MRRMLLLSVLALAALVSSGISAPVTGPEWFRKRVDKASPGEQGKMQPNPLVFERNFKGGERASIVAVGDHLPVVPVGIQVRDKAGNIVAQDLGTGEKTSDYAGVVWYPPRDGVYTIIILNFGAEYNDIALAVK